MSNGTAEVCGKKNPNLPFHPAVRADDCVYLSGQVAKDVQGNMICGTIEEETRATRFNAAVGFTAGFVERATALRR